EVVSEDGRARVFVNAVRPLGPAAASAIREVYPRYWIGLMIGNFRTFLRHNVIRMSQYILELKEEKVKTDADKEELNLTLE
ncbi:Protein of unknown function, partial [Gryllus bimaculatus]